MDSLSPEMVTDPESKRCVRNGPSEFEEGVEISCKGDKIDEFKKQINVLIDTVEKDLWERCQIRYGTRTIVHT